MKYHFISLLLLLLYTTSYSQQSESIEFTSEDFEEAVPWTHLNFHNNPDNFQFAIVSDRTGGHRPGVFGKAVEKLNLLQPEFVMCVGDLIEGYSKDSAVVNAQWDEFHDILEPLEMPFFYLPGNHDFTNTMMKNQWLYRYGRDYYYFVYKNVLFITMNTNDGNGVEVSREQINYTKQVLERFPNVRHTFIFMHHPIWSYGGTDQFTEIEQYLEGRKFTVFAGHTHRYLFEKRKQNNYYVLATTGGGTPLQGPKFGRFDHVTWVTMTEEEPTIVNLKLDGIINHDISTHETAQMAGSLINSTKFKTQVFLSPDQKSEGIRSFSNIFTKGLLKLQVQNTADEPLHFSGNFFHNHQIAVDILKINEDIPPNSSKEFEINLSALKNIPIADLNSLEMDWTIAYKTAKLEQPFQLEGIHKIDINPSPQHITYSADTIFLESIPLEIKQPFQGINIHYTMDGTEPTLQSPVYQAPLNLEGTTELKVKLFTSKGDHSGMMAQTFRKTAAKKAIKRKTKPGLKYAYYEGEFTTLPDYESLEPINTDVIASFNIDSLAGSRGDYYGFTFDGFLEIPTDGVYTFYLNSNDGSQLYIADELVVDNDGIHISTIKPGQIALKKGKHPIKIEYFEGKDYQNLWLGWEGPGIDRESVPFKYLTH